MNQRVVDPMTRMKPQRGRRLDGPAPVVFASAPERAEERRWRPIAFTAVLASIAAAVCAWLVSFSA